MVLVKILGAIDLSAALAFMFLAFGFHVSSTFLLFNAGLLGVKGLFIFMGDVLSVIDIVSALILFISVLFVPPAIFLWFPTFFLLAKGLVSFL